MLTDLNKLRTQAAAAKREWEEMDTAHTSYEMRKKAETRYLTLRALVQSMEFVQQQPTRVTQPEKWRVAASRAVRA